MATFEKRTTKKGCVRIYGKIRMRGVELKAVFERMTDAKAWAQQEEHKIRSGHYLDNEEAARHTLREAVERYIGEEGPTKERRLHLRRWIEAIGGLPLSFVSIVRINDVTSRWKIKGIDGRMIVGATINRHLNSLSMVFRGAKEWGWIARNPVLESKRYPDAKHRVRFLSDDERAALLDECRKSHYKPLYFIVVLALSTGMRKNEIRTLKWKDVDTGTGTIILQHTKNKRRRRVNVRGLALRLLKEHAKVRRIDSEFLFPGECPTTIRPDCVPLKPNLRPYDFTRPWEKAVREAKVEDFRFHDLRHSCASYLAMNNASLLEIAEVLGHTSHDVVKRYAHLGEDYVASVVENMNAKIFGG